MKTYPKLIIAVMILAFLLMPANVLLAYDFHINPQVYTFEAMKEGKAVSAYQKHNRASWEGGVFPAYPVKNS